MNKEELIALKNKLMSTKKYGECNIWNAITQDDIENLLTTDEIIKESKTKEAIEFIENILEKSIEYLCCRGIDFDGIKIDTTINTYISEHYLMKAVDCDDDRERNPLQSNDFLDDYVTATFSFSGYKLDENKKKGIPTEFSMNNEDFFNNQQAFIIKYSEFVILLNQLGYSIDLKSFTDIKTKLLSYDDADPVITVDLTPQKKHTL